ncbi:MAG TPA: tetratricopeptide repeat protein [Ktedonobacteraceae bacterium]|nr:tetratricopeptide repeat protein [Ktedonobacteraceae bacterium]
MAQTTLREYLQITEDAINSDRVNEAFANCQYILTHFPELLEGRRLLGEIYLKQGHLEEAQQTFDWVLTNDPENVVSYCSRALISEQLKDYDTALDCYQQAYELSRGISHIRQEFNQLSEKVGQHGFIFSRAGLARLYMRGDLLPQAIQEWESVLVATPDRLDARTGLLEAFWREGLYDQVEQLAKQILNDIPHCLKALVLLAHVTFAQNALQSRELIQQAKALDPDLVIAQELFSDFMVSHPKDPFLTLLKQSPTVLSEEKQAEPTPVKTAQSVPVVTNGTAAASTFSDPLVRWSSLDNIIEPQQEYQTMQEAASFRSWSSNSSSELDSWSLYGQSAEALEQRNAQAETAHTTQPEQINNEISVIPEQSGTEQERPWYHMDIFEERSAESWKGMLPPMETTPNTSWEEAEEKQDTDMPAPPAWLDMLTKGERREASGKLPARTASTPSAEAEAPSRPQAVEPPLTEPEADGQTPWSAARDSMQTAGSQSAPDDEEGFFFGPEWLKSLGATTFDSPDTTTTTKETPAPAAPFLSKESQPTRQNAPTEPVAEAAPVTPEQPAELTSSSPAETSAQNWLDQAAQKLSTPEQDVLSTLENLEKDLRSQGFLPLEPNSLSAFAQTQHQEPTLSSALAQLGNFEAKPAETPPAEPAWIPQKEEAPVEPLWPSIPEAFTQQPAQPTAARPQEPSPALANHLDTLSQLFSAQATSANATGSNKSEEPRADAQPERDASLTSNPVMNAPAASTPATSYSIPMDMELETTMKRPVVRLQSMQQRPPAHPGISTSRGHSIASKPIESNLSNKERLLKGYQYQLAGSYDDAMQEYRLLIRNAPELLGEVISNMRALLKLAPRYSAGYRVLGDAYMRQGEYLQAMEAYNKALTMAKKAKS